MVSRVGKRASKKWLISREEDLRSAEPGDVPSMPPIYPPPINLQQANKVGLYRRFLAWMHSPGGGFLRVRGDDVARNAAGTLPPLPSPAPIQSCLVPRRPSFDENSRSKEGGKETTGETLRLPSVPLAWSLAVHHHAKNEAPEDADVSHLFLPPLFALFQHQGALFPSIV